MKPVGVIEAYITKFFHSLFFISVEKMYCNVSQKLLSHQFLLSFFIQVSHCSCTSAFSEANSLPMFETAPG